MAKAYNVGDRLYLPVWITNKESNLVMYKDNNELVTDAKFSYVYSQGETRSGEVRYGEPDLLLTAEEIYASRQTADKIEYLTDMLDYGRKKYDEIEELKSRNAELEALLKEVMATRDEAIRQNNELIAENTKLKSDCNDWKDTADDRIVDVQNLTAERDNLKAELDQRNKDFWAMKKDRDELDSIGGKLRAENENLKAWYEEANKTASEAAEANDDLKAKIADLRNRVGEQLAQIQDLNAEIHFLKAERDKFAKTAKDKADLANKACDERNDEHGDLVTAKAAIDYLQEENKKLKQELKDAEASYNVVAETSIKRKNRITTMEEVIVALVEKIRRLESDD